jgi:gluconolactonase
MARQVFMADTRSALCVALLLVLACGASAGQPNGAHSATGGSGGAATAGALGNPPSGGDNAVAGATSGGVQQGGAAAGGSAGAIAVAGGGGSLNPPAGAVCPAGPYAASPLPASPVVQTVCSGMKYTEGAVWLPDRGKLLFSNFDPVDSAHNFPGAIMAYTPGGACEPFIDDAGTNGLALVNSGELLGARQGTHSLARIDLATKVITSVVSGYMGTPFDSLNDVTPRKDGNIYFTDPAWLPVAMPHALYRLDPKGALTALPFPDRHPNGITLSADEQQLFLSLDTPNQIMVFDVAADGALSEPRQFAPDTSDGMVLDCAGNLYLTGAGSVRVYSPQGTLLGTIVVPDVVLPDPSNVAFGGPERKTLYITGSSVLRAIELNIPGYPF